MIRAATLADLPALRVHSEAFVREAFGIGADIDACEKMIAHAIDTGVVFLWEVDGIIGGGIGAITAPKWYRPTLMTAIELFWWVDAAHRKTRAGLSLLKALEVWAEAQGMTLVMSTTGSLNPEELRHLLERRGYQLAEQSFERTV